jgi:outer membrane protein assembly factor BamA
MGRPSVHAAPLARVALVVWAVMVCGSPVTAAQDAPQQPPEAERPILREISIEGGSVFSADDVEWLLKVRRGSPLPDTPEHLAAALQDRYARDGYTEARVTAREEQGRLTFQIDEGRIDEVEITGLDERLAGLFRERFAVKPGDIYNTRTVGQAVDRALDASQGALAVGAPKHAVGSKPGPSAVVLEHRSGRNVLVVPLRARVQRTGLQLGTRRREDFFSPVDALSPALGFGTTIFDHRKFNHTYIEGYAEYRFGPDRPGYSLGIERPLFGGPRLFLGAEIHDLSASDDMWRLTTTEQSLVALGFKNTFRDYYRRHGVEAFGVFQPGGNNEFTLMARWDQHQPLENTTSYSFFRDDHSYRPNPPTLDQDVHSLILGYTFDTRAMTGPGSSRTYQRHLHDDLYGFGLQQAPGLRLEWSSEFAGHGLGGDARFDRHILNTRGYLAFTDRQLLSARALLGFSGGVLPIERQFALGGIGSVHGYGFKEAQGTGIALFNAEYRVRLIGRPHRENDGIAVLGFYDLGRITGPLNGSRTDWLQGTGVGVSLWGLRIDFGFRANDIPESRQVLVRLGPTF